MERASGGTTALLSGVIEHRKTAVVVATVQHGVEVTGDYGEVCTQLLIALSALCMVKRKGERSMGTVCQERVREGR